jgi:hypothetical protein
MPVPFLVQTLSSQQTNGVLYNTYTTAKSVINPTELVVLPANYCRVGTKFRVKAWGGLSNIVTTPGFVTFQIMMGAVAAWSTASIQMTTTANTLTPWRLEATLRVNAAGSGTTAVFIGEGVVSALNLSLSSVANPTVTDTIITVPTTSPANGTGWDSTLSQTIDFWVGFSISNAGNGVQVYDYSVEQLAGSL